MSDGSPLRRQSFGDAFEPLLDAAREGASWAWERLYASLAAAVLGYLRSQGLRDAEDVSSEVWVGVFRNIGDFRGTEAQFRSWVFVIAHRRLQDERRRLGRRPVPEPLDPDRDDNVAAPDDGTEAAALTRIATDKLRQACDQLAPDQRDVVLLRTLADLTVEQIAEVLGKSEGAVKQLQRRGFARLRQVLAKGGVPL